MLILCPFCRIEFSPAYAHCPLCQAFPAPQAARRDFALEDARRRMQQGDNAFDVRDELLACGVPEVEADALIDAETATLRAENRRYGRRWLAAGLGLTSVGGLLLAGVLFAFRGAAGRPIALPMAGLIVVAGAVLIVRGLKSAWSGAAAALTGDDRPS